jgi:hypothetical protein
MGKLRTGGGRRAQPTGFAGGCAGGFGGVAAAEVGWGAAAPPESIDQPRNLAKSVTVE